MAKENLVTISLLLAKTRDSHLDTKKPPPSKTEKANFFPGHAGANCARRSRCTRRGLSDEGFQNGLLIEPGDAQALATAINEFISDAELAANCAANGLRYAIEHFSFDKMMEAKLRADLAVLGKKARRVPVG